MTEGKKVSVYINDIEDYYRLLETEINGLPSVKDKGKYGRRPGNGTISPKINQIMKAYWKIEDKIKSKFNSDDIEKYTPQIVSAMYEGYDETLRTQLEIYSDLEAQLNEYTELSKKMSTEEKLIEIVDLYGKLRKKMLDNGYSKRKLFESIEELAK